MPEKCYFELVVTVFQETPKTLQSVALGCAPQDMGGQSLLLKAQYTSDTGTWGL